MAEYEHTTYDLPGAKVNLHKKPDNNHYYAEVELDGNYPGVNLVAHNVYRKETLHWITGKAQLTINGKVRQLNERTKAVMNDGDLYTLTGKGQAIVFVKDQPGGKTLIEEIK
ncbi:MAG TPA: hypothetical protein VG917_01765 [Patescibacteria group bacterium]|nr:hypothetical protein [Patescibacteria group bacterium]